MRRRLLFLLLFAAAAASGCFSKPKPVCAFLCGPSDQCPADYVCSATDNRCHLLESGAPLACDDTLPADAAVVDVAIPDAGPADADVPDADVPDADVPDA